MNRLDKKYDSNEVEIKLSRLVALLKRNVRSLCKAVTLSTLYIAGLTVTVSQWASCSITKGDRPCYINYNYPAEYQKIATEIRYIYTGKEIPPLDGVIQRTVAEGPYTTKWIKRKTDKNCLSEDPEDCLQWCLVEEPANYVTIWEIKDTNSVKPYRADTLWEKVLVSEAYTEQVEVVCDRRITPILSETINIALDSAGVLPTDYANWRRITESTMQGIRAIQRKYGLPVGDLDIETLELLEIPWNE